MNKNRSNTLLGIVKSFFSAVRQELQTWELEDGTYIMENEEGIIINADTLEPIADGEYTLKEGVSITITDGKLVKPTEEPVEDVSTETPEVEVEVELPSEDMDPKDELIKSLEDRIKELESKLLEYETMSKEDKEKLSALETKLSAQFKIKEDVKVTVDSKSKTNLSAHENILKYYKNFNLK